MAHVGTFDTYKAVSNLQKRGLSKDAAEGITDLLKDVIENNTVTKANLDEAVHDLEDAMHKQSLSLIKWITGVLLAHGMGTAALTVALLQLLR